MPRINQRFLLTLIVISTVLAGGLYGVYVYQVSKQTDFFLARADAAFEEGRIETAANLYRHVIEHDPDNFQALGKLADCLDRLGKYVDAYILYEASARAAEDPNRHLNKQIELAIRLDRWNDTETLLARGLQASPDDPQLLLLKAQALYRQGEPGEAIKTFEEVCAKEDAPQEAYVLLAHVYQQQDDVDAAERVVNSLREKHNDKAAAHVFAAQWYLKRLGERPSGQGPETADVNGLRRKLADSVAAARRCDPEATAVLQVGLQEARLRQDEDTVMALAERGAALHPQEPMFYQFAAESAFRQEQPDVAADWLKKGMQRIPNNSTLLWDYVGLKLDRDEIDEAEQLVNNRGDRIEVAMRKAAAGRILVARGQWKAALQEFDAIQSDLITRPGIAPVVSYEQAVCYGHLRQYDQQISALRKALNQQPAWPEAREALARALYVSGRTDEAVQELRPVVAKESYTVGSGLLMGRLLIAQMARRDPEDARWAEVDEFLDTLDDGGVPHEEIVRLRCAMLVSMGELDQAEAYVRAELAKSPSLPASVGLALIQSERGDWNTALETIREAAREFGDSVETRRAEAICLLAAEQVDPSRFRELATAPADWSAQQKSDLAVQLLPVVLAADQLNVAEDMIEELIAHQPNTMSFRIEHLKLAHLRQDPELIRSILKDIERIAGQTAYWHYGEAVRLWSSRPDGQPLSNEDMQAAVRHLSKAGLERPSWAQVPLLHALMMDAAGKSEAAVSKYDEAVDLGVRDPQVIRRLMDLLMDAGRFAEADVTLRRLNEQTTGESDNAPTLRIASEMNFHRARLENAVQLAEQAADKSETAEDYLWLAQLRQMQKQNEAAGAAFEKALEMNPLSQEVRLAYIRFLIREQQRDQAVRTVKQYAESVADNQNAGPDAQLTLADCYLAIEDHDQAARALLPSLESACESSAQLKRTLRILFALQGVNREIPTVGDFLRRTLAAADDREIQMLARRELALLAARDIFRNDIDAAMDLVQTNLSLDPDSRDDLRAKAIVLAAWPNAERRGRAIEILEKLDRQDALDSAEDRFLLAQLYINRGQWGHGARLMREVLSDPDEQTERPMHFYAQSLLNRGERRNALLWAETLLSAHPSVEATRLHATALIANGEIERLLRLLPPTGTSAKFADTYREFLTPQDSAEILGRFARELIARDQRSLAPPVIERCEQISHDLIDDNAFPGSGIAHVLVATGRLDAACDLLEQSAPSGSEIELVRYVEAILERPELPNAAARRLNEILATEQKRRNGAPELLLAIAQIQEKMRAFENAIGSYRELIAADPQNKVALNNLAFLLALQGRDANAALTYAQRALMLAGPAAEILDTYAVALISNGQASEAIELLKSITSVPSPPARRFHLAWAYMTAGEERAAEQAMKLAREQGFREDSLHPLEQPHYALLKKARVGLAN